MAYFEASLIGLTVGAGTGWVAQHLPVPSLLQSVSATLVALVLGTGLMMLLWYRRLAVAGMATGYFGVGTDNLLRLGIVCVIAGAVHVALSGVESLTPSERRVAQMAAEGSTNRQIAQDLFVTTKTVEVHLSSVYRKLDIASRTQLAAALAGAPVAGES